MFSVRSSSNLLRTSLLPCLPSSSSSLRVILPYTRTFATEVAKPTTVSQDLSHVEALFRTYKPVTPSIRHLKRPINKHLWEGRPVRALTIPLRKNGGRNNTGRITVRHRGGGHKQRIRIVDFKRYIYGVHDVIRIEYDPGRSAHIALVWHRESKKFSYILACDGMRAGDTVESFRNGIPDDLVPGYIDYGSQENKKKREELGEEDTSVQLAIGLVRARTIKLGNVLPLRLIPNGTLVHCLSLRPDGPAILVRAAGTFATVIAQEPNNRYTQIKLQSGEIRKVLRDCCATIGKVSNGLWKGRVLAKAGRRRWLGWRPSVRGMAMNPCDHPHGGGRGKSKGNKQAHSIWGWIARGVKTRKPGPNGPKNNNKLVIRERPRGRAKRSG